MPTKTGSRRTYRANTGLTLFLLCFLSLTCKTLELKSHWRDREVTIDGNRDEWQDIMMAVGQRNASIGLLNDGKDLYLCLATTDRDLQRQIMRQGLTLWFDRKSHEEKAFGIHFPLAQVHQFGGPGREWEQKDTLREPSQLPNDEVEIFGPEEHKSQRMSMIETGGIEIKVAVSHDTLVYEAKVPLTDYGPQPFAIGAEAGSIISIGLETMTQETTHQGGDRPQGMGGNRGDGFGGGRRPRAGYGGRGAGGGGSGEPLNVWTRVALAAEASRDSVGLEIKK